MTTREDSKGKRKAMTRLFKAKMTLGIVCGLFFLLGTGSIMAVAPLLSLQKWWQPEATRADRNWDKILGLTGEQTRQRDALLREEDAALEQIQREIKRTFYPRIHAIHKRTYERYRAILTPGQRKLFDGYSTGKLEPPGNGK